MNRFVTQGTWLVAAALLLASCATAPAPPPAASAAAPVTGRLVAVRPVTLHAVRAPVLGALGMTAADTAVAVVECIVLADDGRTLSVVQPESGGLRPGLRVTLQAGGAPLAAARLAVAAASP